MMDINRCMDVNKKGTLRFFALRQWLSGIIGILFFTFSFSAFASISSPSTSTSGNYTVSWTDSGYSQYCNAGGGFDYAVLLTERKNGVTISSHEFASGIYSYDFSNGTSGDYTYQLKVRKCGPSGAYYYYTNSTSTIVGTLNEAPTANAGLDKTSNEGSLTTLAGSGSDTDGTVASYFWYQVVGPTVTLNNKTTATPNFVAPTVSQDTVVIFVLTVTDNDGATDYDDVVITIKNVLPPPSAPSSITVPSTDNNGAYTISWSASSTATKYQLQESVNSGAWTTLTSTTTSTSYSRTGRGNGSYKYQVRAYNTSGWSGYRVSSSLTVLLPPSTPSSITVPATDTDGAYTISWASASTATKYQLQESKNSGSWITLTSTTTSTSYSRTGRSSGSYKYQVRAYNASGWSSYRTSSSVIVNAIPIIAGIPNTTAILGESYSFIPEASDADNDTLTFTISSKPAWASFDTSTGQLSGTPTPLGIDTNIIISVNDGRGGSASLSSFNINVRDSYVVPSQRRCQP